MVDVITLDEEDTSELCTPIYRCDFCSKCCTSKLALRQHLQHHVCVDPSCSSCNPQPGENHADWTPEVPKSAFHTRRSQSNLPFSPAKENDAKPRSSDDNTTLSDFAWTPKPRKLKSHNNGKLLSNRPLSAATENGVEGACNGSLGTDIVQDRTVTWAKSLNERKVQTVASPSFVQRRGIRIRVARHVYFCIECNRSYLTKYYLFKHEKTHSEERSDENSFTCDECGKSYVSKYNLLRHGRLHSSFNAPLVRKTPKHPLVKHFYFCIECSRQFARKSALDKHEGTHGVGSDKDKRSEDSLKIVLLSCEECGSSFTTKYNLQRHEKLHSPSTLHICSVCNKGFALEWYLKVHLSSHSEVRKYSCAVCDSFFKTKYGLSKHQKKKCHIEPG